MRISDWSSDVCSSDLGIDLFQRQAFDRSVEDVERRGGCGEDLPVIHRINELAGERDRIARGGGFHGILITRPERGDLAVELEITRSEEHTSELQSLMRISYAVFCLKKKKKKKQNSTTHTTQHHQS